jgi:hypothetical protein
MTIARMVGSSAAQALTGGAALVLTVAVAAAVEWKEHEDAKKLQSVKDDVEQARSYFGNVIVPGYKSTKVLKLPDFWDMTNPEKPKSMFLPLETIRQMVNAPGSSKPVLHVYDNAVRSILRGYFLFYETCYSRWIGGSADDANTLVKLRNLILLVSEHFSKFEGYGLDIRLLEVLQEYNEAFAEGHEERTRYLIPINESIVEARNALLEHSKKLSFEETIEDAWPICKQVTEGIMSDLTQLLTQKNLRKYTEFAKPELLEQGIVKAEFFKWFHFGTHPQRIDLVDSEFKREFMDAMKDYRDITRLSVIPPSKPPVQLSIKEQAKLDKKKKEEMLDFFKGVENFLTRVSDQNVVQGSPQSPGNDPQKPIKLVPVTNQPILDNRSNSIRNLIKTFRKMTNILKILYRAYEYANYVGPQLASIDPDVNNNDSLYVVHVLNGFNVSVKKLAKVVETDLNNIITSFQGAMLDPDERKLYRSILDHILTMKGEVFERINDIIKDKLQQKPDDADREIQKEKHALLSFIHDLAIAENIQTPFTVIQQGQQASSSVSHSSAPEEKHALLKTVDVDIQTDIASSDIEHHTAENKGFFSKIFSSPTPHSVEMGTDPIGGEVEEEKHDNNSTPAATHPDILPRTVLVGIDSQIQTEIASSDVLHHTIEDHGFFSKLFPSKWILADVGTQTVETESSKSKEVKDDSLFGNVVITPSSATMPRSQPVLLPVDGVGTSSPQSSPISHTTPLLDKSNRSDAEPESVSTFEDIDAMLASIKTNVENKSHPNDLKRFNAIYNAISELRYHASKLQNERLACRHERASLLKSLVYAVAHSVDEFLKQPHTSWISNTVSSLSQDIHAEIADSKYRSLSRMQPVGMGRFFYNTPATMRKIHEVQSKLTNLAEHFTPQQPTNEQTVSRRTLSKH